MIGKRQLQTLAVREYTGVGAVARTLGLLRRLLTGGRAWIAETCRGARLGGGKDRAPFPSQGYMDARPFFVFGITQPTLLWLDAAETATARRPGEPNNAAVPRFVLRTSNGGSDGIQR